MRISDWSSDVCSSDLADADGEEGDAAKKRENFEEDEEDNTLSLAAMEELLKPDALEKFAAITKSFKAFQKLQDARLEALSSAGEEFPAASLKKYNKLREELTALVERVQFHGTKIDYIVDQLYSYNRRLTALGGQMLRLAERHKVPRRSEAHTSNSSHSCAPRLPSSA